MQEDQFHYFWSRLTSRIQPKRCTNAAWFVDFDEAIRHIQPTVVRWQFCLGQMARRSLIVYRSFVKATNFRTSQYQFDRGSK